MGITKSITNRFKQHFSEKPRIFQAPGRVNLIGEHTDYNDGFVFPIAINRTTKIAIAKKDNRLLTIWSEDFKEIITIDLDDNSTKRGHWSDYIAGIAFILEREGYKLVGANIYIESDVPVGAGLSSSAALEVSTAYALLTINNYPINKTKLALLCQRAENEYVGMNCGIMDQFIACYGQAGKAMFLDCRTLDFELVSLNSDDIQIIICNTMVKHELSASEYNIRRKECELGVERIALAYPEIKALRDVSLTQFHSLKNGLSETIRKRCFHVIGENQRVLMSKSNLQQHDLLAFGKLMNASHESLKNDYDVSCTELDIMVNIAKSLPGVLGARMTGGGFGGCTVNLVKKENVENFCHEISTQYFEKRKLQPEIYICFPSNCVEEL